MKTRKRLMMFGVFHKKGSEVVHEEGGWQEVTD